MNTFTAADARELMPQAKIETLLQPIINKIREAAANGKRSIVIYEGTHSHHLQGITAWGEQGSASNSVAAAVAQELVERGFACTYTAGVHHQRDPSPAKMHIYW